MKLTKAQHSKLVEDLYGWVVGVPPHTISTAEAESLALILDNTLGEWILKAMAVGWEVGYQRGVRDEIRGSGPAVNPWLKDVSEDMGGRWDK